MYGGLLIVKNTLKKELSTLMNLVEFLLNEVTEDHISTVCFVAIDMHFYTLKNVSFSSITGTQSGISGFF